MMTPKSAVGSELRRSARVMARELARFESREIMKEMEVSPAVRGSEKKEKKKKKKKKKKKNTIKIYINSGHTQILPTESTLDYEKPHEVEVDPQMQIRDFVKMIQPLRWIPKQTVLVTNDYPPRRLQYSSTIARSGVRDGDILFACKGGSFCLFVLSNFFRMRIGIRVDSSFDTIAKVKTLIHKSCYRLPEDQVITSIYDDHPIPDNTTLLSLGIVKPYNYDMMRTISLRVVFKD